MLNRFLKTLTATGHSGGTDRTADAPRTCDVTPLECKSPCQQTLREGSLTTEAEFLAPSYLAGSVAPRRAWTSVFLSAISDIRH